MDEWESGSLKIHRAYKHLPLELWGKVEAFHNDELRVEPPEYTLLGSEKKNVNRNLNKKTNSYFMESRIKYSVLIHS